MALTSLQFFLFFAIVMVVRLGLRTANQEKWFLLLASFGFYMSWSVPTVVFIAFTSLVDYAIARKLGQTTDPQHRRRLLVLSLAMSLGLLAFFKYGNFFLENVSALLRLAGMQVGTLRYE